MQVYVLKLQDLKRKLFSIKKKEALSWPERRNKMLFLQVYINL